MEARALKAHTASAARLPSCNFAEEISVPRSLTWTSRNQTGVIAEKLNDSQIALKPGLGAAFSDSSKIFCQEMTRFHDKDTIAPYGSSGVSNSHVAQAAELLVLSLIIQACNG
jgi:hypothetical protein